jgi:hypothetical protein
VGLATSHAAEYDAGTVASSIVDVPVRPARPTVSVEDAREDVPFGSPEQY